MMPLPVILAFAILIGWPSLKLFAVLSSRPKWRRVKQLSAQLKADPRYKGTEQKIIDQEILAAKGEPLQILMPILVLFGGIALAFVGFPKKREFGEKQARSELMKLQVKQAELEYSDLNLSPDSPLWSDMRFRELVDLTFELGMLRYPVASIFTLLSLIVIAPLVLVAEGVRASWKLIVLKLTLRRIVYSSAYLSRAYARSLGVI